MRECLKCPVDWKPFVKFLLILGLALVVVLLAKDINIESRSVVARNTYHKYDNGHAELVPEDKRTKHEIGG